MAGDSVRQRQFLAGARLPKRLLRLSDPVQANPAASVRAASPHSSRTPSWCVCSAGEVVLDHNK